MKLDYALLLQLERIGVRRLDMTRAAAHELLSNAKGFYNPETPGLEIAGDMSADAFLGRCRELSLYRAAT